MNYSNIQLSIQTSKFSKTFSTLHKIAILYVIILISTNWFYITSLRIWHQPSATVWILIAKISHYVSSNKWKITEIVTTHQIQRHQSPSDWLYHQRAWHEWYKLHRCHDNHNEVSGYTMKQSPICLVNDMGKEFYKMETLPLKGRNQIFWKSAIMWFQMNLNLLFTHVTQNLKDKHLMRVTNQVLVVRFASSGEI